MKQDSYDQLMKTLVSYGNLKYDDYYGDISYIYDSEDNELCLRWKTGEDSGGSWRGGKATYSPSKTREPNFDVLDLLLMEIDPQFTLANYKTVLSTIEVRDVRESEYYGNATYYDEKVLDKDKFIYILNKIGIELNDSLISMIDDKITNLYISASEPSQAISSGKKYRN